ncbi:MAG: site-2 protease family protein [Anaerolineae bacterium]|nr:site-2 protease family protein [Thermoflexales bacterium]MCX7937840.1 site-2 protease family protein [Thermoflexales bacterium]MDW8054671.1 site-2 protease family protein [Anaerolineae bacterium]
MNEQSATSVAPLSGLSESEMLMVLRARVAEVMSIEAVDASGDERVSAVKFIGKLRLDASAAFEHLRTRLAALGYVPLLREAESEREMVVAVRGEVAQSAPQNLKLSLLLFLATLLTTTLFGGMFAWSLSRPTTDFSLVGILSNGIPFSVALMTILGAHELGHYAAARRHKLAVTLPYFIPVPLPGTLGTLGAFIQIRAPARDRRVLFDVGLSGPLAGLLVAIPLYVVGLMIAEVSPDPAPSNRSFLIQTLTAFFRPEAAGNGVYLNPILLAARFGLVVTAINLLPVGQLDGGHIAYAALGSTWAKWLSYLAIAFMAVLGVTVSSTWLVWMLFALFSGAARAQPMNDLTPLDFKRAAAFLGTVALFFALFTARPL